MSKKTSMTFNTNLQAPVKLNDIEHGCWFFFDDEVGTLGIKLKVTKQAYNGLPNGIPCAILLPESIRLGFYVPETEVHPIEHVTIDLTSRRS